MEKTKKQTGKKAAGTQKTPAKLQAGAKKPAARACRPAGIRKQYFKTKPLCRVSFLLPGIAAPAAANVCIVGDFNNWSITQHPMKRLKNGDFSIVLDLEPGREYQFRYLIDECRWENDWKADKYVASCYGDCENSVVIV